MNQHFNKKSIEAAIRVAMVMPNKDILLNGNRSKAQYSVYYDKDERKLYLNNVIHFSDGDDYGLIAVFDINSPTKQQHSVSGWVGKVVDIVCNEITA